MTALPITETPLRKDPEWGFGHETREARQDELIDILARLPIFDALSEIDLKKVERIVHRRRFDPGEVVIRAWVPRTGLFVILSGSVNVVRPMASDDGVVIGRLDRGELLGEFAILDDTPRSTSIVAAEPCDLIGFFRPDLMDLIETDPRLGFKILYRLCQIMSSRLSDVVGNLRRLRAGLRETAT